MLYRLVVFDWEGTLGDTLGQVLHALDVEAARLHLGEFDHQLARQSMGYGLARAIKKLFPHLAAEDHDELIQAVQQFLLRHPSDVYLIPGAREIVQSLQQAGVFLAIASNRSQQSLQRALQATELDVFFPVTRTAGQVPNKPCPQMIEEIIADYGLQPEKTLMVGDSVADVEMANYAGVDAVAVDFYHQQQEALHRAGALHVFNDYSQLANFLQLPD
jgi:phosphoglycolate phosphatase